MTIGAWVGVGVSLMTLFITVSTILVKVTSKFTTSVTELNVTMKGLGEKITNINCENKKQHDNLFGIAREHGDKLADHEARISIIESKPPRTKRTA